MNIAIIPARGGSVRCPRKNIELLPHAVAVCKAARLVDEVRVLTDCDEIARMAEAEEIPVLRDPPKGPHKLMVLMRHALDELQSSRPAIMPENLVAVQCTSPFTTPQDIDDCISARGDADCALTASRFKHPVRAVGPMWQKNLVFATGAVYCFGPGFIVRGAGNPYVGEVVTVHVPFERSLDVDTPFEIALYRGMRRLLHVSPGGLGALVSMAEQVHDEKGAR